MRQRTGVLPKDYKHLFQSKINSGDLKELARTILAAAVMLVLLGICFLAAFTSPEPPARNPVSWKGGGQLDGSHPVAARRQQNP